MLQDSELQEDECSCFSSTLTGVLMWMHESSAEVSRRNSSMKLSVLITTSSPLPQSCYTCMSFACIKMDFSTSSFCNSYESIYWAETKSYAGNI